MSSFQDFEISYPVYAELPRPASHTVTLRIPPEDRIVQGTFETFLGGAASTPFGLFAAENTGALRPAENRFRD